jgi:hypothetical protein
LLLTHLEDLAAAQQTEIKKLIKTSSSVDRPALEETLNVTSREIIIAQLINLYPEYLSQGPSALDESLERNSFEINGKVLSNESKKLNIGGIEISNIYSPLNQNMAGSQLTVEGLIKDGYTYIYQLKIVDQTNDLVSVEGYFEGVSQDGLFWKIGGLLLSAPLNLAAPGVGTQVKLEGTITDGKFVPVSVTLADESESESDQTEQSSDNTQTYDASEITREYSDDHEDIKAYQTQSDSDSSDYDSDRNNDDDSSYEGGSDRNDDSHYVSENGEDQGSKQGDSDQKSSGSDDKRS